MSKRIPLGTLLARLPKPAPGAPLPPITRRIFLLAFLTEFIVIYPFYVIMFGERGNVSAAGVGLLLAIWMTVSVVAEIPTGVIADKFSKKWSLVLGHILQLATFSTWFFVPNLTGYLIGFVLWGIGEAFISGAFQAYLYESLDDANKQSFGKIYSRSSAFLMLAYTVGGFVAFLIGPRYDLLLLLSMLVSASSLALTLTLPATHSKVEVEVEVKPQALLGALQAIKSKILLRRILIGAVIIQGLMSALGEYLPAYYNQVGAPTRYVALIISAGAAIAFVLYWWMHQLESFIAKHQATVVIGATALFVLSFLGGTMVAVLGFFLFTRMLRVMSVHNETQIQHHAPDESRATLSSINSFASKLLSAALLALIGAFAVEGKIITPLRWSVVALMGLFAVVMAYYWLRLRTHKSANLAA